MDNQHVQNSEAVKSMSFFSKFVNIFVNPNAVFQQIKIRPDWILPLLVVFIFSTLFSFSIQDIQIKETKKKIIASERLSDEQKDTILKNMEESQGSPTRTVMTTVSILIWLLLSYVVAAGALWVGGNFILGGEARFVHLLSLFSYVSLISVLEIIVKLPLVLQKESLRVYTSLALLFDPDTTSKAMLHFADAVDIFNIWRLILIISGFSIIYNFNKSKSTTVVLSLYIVYLVIALLLKNLFGGFI